MEPQPAPSAARRPRANADYRWTLPKALAFLDALARCGKVAEAARAVGMSRQSAYCLRARLAGTPLEQGWKVARATGIMARRGPRSRWEGPGLGSLPHAAQADTPGRQADALPGKPTQSGPS